MLGADAVSALIGFFSSLKNYLLIFAGFSLVIFFHELGHFLAAKWCDVRVEKFAVGFGKELFGFTRGETRYSFNVLPLGGYVKMLGQEDFTIDKSGELKVKDDPRAFTHKPVGQRMFIVSAGVVMNLLFASFVFMLVFLIGIKFPKAEIGFLDPESPAERANLKVGDRILEINGQPVADFNDVRPAILLADPDEASHVKIERPSTDGGPPSILTVAVQPERNEEENRLQIGVAPPMSNKVGFVLPDPAFAPEEQLKAGDVIEEVSGQKVSDLMQIHEALVRLKGRVADLTVTRPQGKGPDQIVHLKRRARMVFRPTGDMSKESGHLLGLVPRREIIVIDPGDRADMSGIKPGDIIVRWGQWTAPTLAEILRSIADNTEKDISITVLRPSPAGSGEEKQLTVRPRSLRAWVFFKTGKSWVGMTPHGQEEDRLVVADIIPKIVDKISSDITTPAAKLKSIMPRGSLITKVNGQPVRTWTELSEVFVKLAGTDVKLSWTYENQPEESETIHVPHTLGTTFHLPPEHRITKVNGMSNIEMLVDGRPVTYTAESSIGAREILRKAMGQTIEVEHRGFIDPKPVVEKVTVTPEMLDTWVQRNLVDSGAGTVLATEYVLTEIRETNPLKATMIGVRKTYYFIEQVYMMMKRMIFTRSVDINEVSGPVGIVKMGSDIAAEDFVKLLYFLALISANLAVINFLPMPIVDGGLFVFLLIEKIKGSPISIRVQVTTQVIGVMLIIGIFLYVTLQDLQKYLPSGWF